MSLFFDYKLNLNEELPAVCGWSNSEYQPILAIGTRSGKVLFFTEEGERFNDLEITRQSTPCEIVWHPYLSVVFICWEDGAISHWSENSTSAKEEKSIHGCKIRGITISPDGTRMVTGDDHGVVGVWSISRGLNPICQFQKEGAITNLAFCALANEHGEVPSFDQMNQYFFFAGSSGSVYLADDMKRCSEMCKVGGKVRSLLYYREENSVVIITSSLLLVQFRVSPNEKLTPTRKVKMTIAGNPNQLYSIWGGPGLLVTVSGENMIRLWNLEQDKNYFLTLADADTTGKLLGDKVNCIAYHEKKRILAGGTEEGRVVMWKSKYLLTGEAPSSSEGWEPQLPITLSSSKISQISWASGESILSAASHNSLSILTEAMLKKRVKDNSVVLQVSNNTVEVRRLNKFDSPMQVHTGIRIKGLDVTSSHLVVWSGKRVECHSLPDSGSGESTGSFEKQSFMVAAHRESVIVGSEAGVEVCNHKGVVKQTLSISESEGEITGIDVFGDNMVVTTESSIRLYDLSRREYKLKGMPRKFEDKQGQTLGIIRGGCINSEGTKVALLVDQAPKPSLVFPDTFMYVYDTEIDNFLSYDFGPTQIPTETSWDLEDPRLLVVETEGLSIGEEDENPEEQFKEAVCMFVTSEYGMLKQDNKRLEDSNVGVIGVSVPYLFFVGREVGKDNLSGIGKVVKTSLRDFTGLEDCDESTKKAILNFSFHLTNGNMDEAYKSVKVIQSLRVWENMCHMSVKTKRMDVAEVCLGNMRFARGAKAVREAKSEKELDSQLAMVAIQLNMLNEAKDLYAEAERPDLLNKMLQASGQWEEAVQVSETQDRISLKSTYYNLARHYESVKDFSNAIENYELAGAYQEEVPRMLHANNKLTDLERYINNKKDPLLYKWWAQYMESKGDFTNAIKFYELAEDFGSCVRVHIAQGNFQGAASICQEKSTKLGCLRLAKYLEEQGEIRDAIQLYTRAKTYHHAVRLAKEHKLDADLMSLALRSTNTKLMLQTALYFENKHLLDRAVVLYHKGKNVKKAMDLCFQSNNYDYLRSLVDDLGEEEDPDTLLRAAEYFLDQNMYEKAVSLLVSAKQYSRALELSLSYNVKVDDNLVEKMIPQSSDPQSKELLRRICKLCKRQGSFQLACKLYTKLGEKLKGFKCLLRLGDVDRIKQFANTAKNSQIYVLAANFLQNSDWHNNPELMKTIIFFYTKAKAWDSLATFFDTCASLEIDEYRDYEKAVYAEKEALKYQAKSTSPNRDQNFQSLQRKLELMELFVSARKMATSDPQEMQRICMQLLETRDSETAIRIGDLYALLVEFYYSYQDLKSALHYVNAMKQRRIYLNAYLDMEMVKNIHRGMGVQFEQDDEDDLE